MLDSPQVTLKGSNAYLDLYLQHATCSYKVAQEQKYVLKTFN